MGKRKYEECVKQPTRRGPAKLNVEKLSRFIAPVPFMVFDKTVQEKTPFWIEFCLVYGPGPGPGSGVGDLRDNEPLPVKAPDGTTMQPTAEGPNKHPFEEVFLFLPTDPHNVDDLGAEIEFWIGEGEVAEKYIITKPSMVFIPKNTVHCPVWYRRIDRPIILVEILNAPELTHGLTIERVGKWPPTYSFK